MSASTARFLIDACRVGEIDLGQISKHKNARRTFVSRALDARHYWRKREALEQSAQDADTSNGCKAGGSADDEGALTLAETGNQEAEAYNSRMQ